MHESVIPLGHKQHSTQTLKYVDKNFVFGATFFAKLIYSDSFDRWGWPLREAYDRAALQRRWLHTRLLRDLWHLHLLAELYHILLASRKTNFSCGCSRN
jgi:hypothetical protein